MIIIGEKINGFIPATMKAIEAHDDDYIRKLARDQAEFGASYIDVCPGVAPEIERETMNWLVGLVQEVTDVPLSIDSPDPQVIVDTMPLAKTPGILNSASMEKDKCDVLFQAIAGTEWKCVCLTCDDEHGVPSEASIKFEIAQQVMEKAAKYGVANEQIFFDPVVTTLGTTPDALISFMEASRMILDAWPGVTITSGLTNISHGMPMRKYINMQFLSLAMGAGMTSAIMDPTSRDMRTVMYTVDALLGNDKKGLKLLKAYRKDLIGPPKDQRKK